MRIMITSLLKCLNIKIHNFWSHIQCYFIIQCQPNELGSFFWWNHNAKPDLHTINPLLGDYFHSRCVMYNVLHVNHLYISLIVSLYTFWALWFIDAVQSDNSAVLISLLYILLLLLRPKMYFQHFPTHLILSKGV